MRSSLVMALFWAHRLLARAGHIMHEEEMSLFTLFWNPFSLLGSCILESNQDTLRSILVFSPTSPKCHCLNLLKCVGAH